MLEEMAAIGTDNVVKFVVWMGYIHLSIHNGLFQCFLKKQNKKIQSAVKCWSEQNGVVLCLQSSNVPPRKEENAQKP